MQQTTPLPRPAATVILARDTTHGIEVFLMKRTTEVTFAKGMHVFPGGGLDAADGSKDMHALCVGMNDALASAALGVEQGGLAYWVAAIRECFEEAGLLIGYRHEQNRYAQNLSPLIATDAPALAILRAQLAEKKLSFTEGLQQTNLRAGTDQLVYFSHWVTQPGRPRRYDTRFFVAAAPAEQIAMHDNSETVAHLWVRPSQALELNQRGELNLMFPTLKTLETLTRFHRVEDLLAYARAKPPAVPTTPHISIARDGSIRPLIPGDYAYAEVRKIDPDNIGFAKSDIDPGQAVKIAPEIWRITAANPGVMTGPGTNTYLLGSATSGIAVIDPGPDLASHIEAIRQCAAGPIQWILCTHTHRDHSPAAIQLQAMTGAQLIGMPPPHYANQDLDFKPDYVPSHGELLQLAGITLRVIHTPGHASNHLCFLHLTEKILFTGDHLMQGSTVVINPPDGDMSTYLSSLRRLSEESIDYLAPGHGFLMGNPQEAIERVLLHRQDRENKILSALRQSGGSSGIDALVAIAYQDVPVQRHALATRSLLAHLYKLQQENRVLDLEGQWQLAAAV